jgi:hypothetical protein
VTDSKASINLSSLYKLASFKKFTSGVLELTVPSGTDLNTFTFGN